MHHEDVDGLLVQLHGQMRQRALPGRAVADLAGVLAQVGRELGDRVDGQLAVDDQHVGCGADHAHCGEVLDRVIRQLAACGRAGAVGGHITLHQRVAVGRRPGGGLAGDGATAAADVLDHEVLAQRPAPAFGDGAAHQVAAATGRHGHDVANGLDRESLGARCTGQPQGSRQTGEQMSTLHDWLRLVCFGQGIARLYRRPREQEQAVSSPACWCAPGPDGPRTKPWPFRRRAGGGPRPGRGAAAGTRADVRAWRCVA